MRLAVRLLITAAFVGSSFTAPGLTPTAHAADAAAIGDRSIEVAARDHAGDGRAGAVGTGLQGLQPLDGDLRFGGMHFRGVGSNG